MATDDRNEHRPYDDDRNDRRPYDDRNDRRPHRDDPTGARSQDATRASVGREHEEYGGVKVGSAFFGWLTAVGMSVLLTALLAAAGAAVGLAQQTDVQDVDAGSAETIGLVSGIILLLVLFLAYYCGG
ncbi:hypothetical protein PU560_04480, partial [Georgenia sp. 10Sc9-8]|nr:hypothetical protein [Georgenia halotolerans]